MNPYCQLLAMNPWTCAQLQGTGFLFSTAIYAIMAALPLLLLYLVTINILDVFVNGWGYPGDLGPWFGGRMLEWRNFLFPFFAIGWAWCVGCVVLASRPH
jgi:hypothetical protein